MKMLAIKSRLRIENRDNSGAPNIRYCPRGESREQIEKQVNIRLVDRKAVGIIDGFIRMTVSKRGPRPKPVQNAKPSSNPILYFAFFPLSSGVANRVNKNPIAAKEIKKTFPTLEYRLIKAPAAAAIVDMVRHV